MSNGRAAETGSRRIAVIGGGWAGLAAAVEATARGDRVTLYEMAPQLGGRARSVETTQGRFDNGQHILIGAYVQTLALMRRVGIDPGAVLLRRPLALVDPRGLGLVLPGGPPLIAFVRGVLARRGWSWRERTTLLAAALRWQLAGFDCEPTATVHTLCRALPERLIADLIDPLCVAALNTPAEAASGRVFLRVLRDALFSGAGSADLLLPRAPLDELLPVPAARWLAHHGAELRCAARVRRLLPDAGGWLVDGERYAAVVLATTAVEAARLVAEHAPAWAAAAGAFAYQPIVTVYARSAGTRLSHPMLALPAPAAPATEPAQFVFDHGQLGGPAGLLAFVISGAAAWVERGSEATVAATLAQARQRLGDQLRGPVTALQTLVEKRATFACVPGLARPPRHIAPGLAAAGDYIAGPYPATLEGAVRSGVAAAAAFDGPFPETDRRP